MEDEFIKLFNKVKILLSQLSNEDHDSRFEVLYKELEFIFDHHKFKRISKSHESDEELNVLEEINLKERLKKLEEKAKKMQQQYYSDLEHNADL